MFCKRCRDKWYSNHALRVSEMRGLANSMVIGLITQLSLRSSEMNLILLQQSKLYSDAAPLHRRRHRRQCRLNARSKTISCNQSVDFLTASALSSMFT